MCTYIAVWIVVFVLTCPVFWFAQTGYMTKITGTNSSSSNVDNQSHEALLVNSDFCFINLGRVVEGDTNCWDDAGDKEFPDYIPYGIMLHLLGVCVPFSIIAWCYSCFILTIFQTLHSQLSSYNISREKGVNKLTEGKGEGIIIILYHYEGMRGSLFSLVLTPLMSTGANLSKQLSPSLLFAFCFFPFHVTVFPLLKVAKGVHCQAMTAISMCYKITRPLASFNAGSNALFHFLTKDPVLSTSKHGHLFLLKMVGKVEDVEGERMEDRKQWGIHIISRKSIVQGPRQGHICRWIDQHLKTILAINHDAGCNIIFKPFNMAW